MNIVYDINSDTGIMRLKFKKDCLNPLKDKKEIFYLFFKDYNTEDKCAQIFSRGKVPGLGLDKKRYRI